MSHRTIILIANLSSNNHRDQNKFDHFVLEQLKENKIDTLFYQTENLKDLQKIIRESCQNGFTEFVSIGGDGTLHHTINQLLEHSPSIASLKVAILPKGTGNDYIRNFAFRSKREILQAIIAHKYTSVDIGRLTFEHGKSHFVNMLGLGFSAAVVKKLSHYKWLGGISYYFALVGAFFSYQAQAVDLEIDGIPYSAECFQLSIGIGKYAGNNMKLCPEALINDGFFDINIIEKVSLWKLLRYIHTLRDGSYLHHIPSRSFRAKTVKLLNASSLGCEVDGEAIDTPLEVNLLKHTLHMASN